MVQTHHPKLERPNSSRFMHFPVGQQTIHDLLVVTSVVAKSSVLTGTGLVTAIIPLLALVVGHPLVYADI